MDSPQTNEPDHGGVASVETTIRIIESIQSQQRARLTDLADDTGLSKGAVYKHLLTLSKHGFVEREDDVYRLGFRFLDLGGQAQTQYPGSSLIRSKVRDLASETGEVALFTLEENYLSVTLFRELGTHGVFTRSRIGKRLPLHQTASGKAIMAQFPDSKVQSILDSVGLPKATENTITDPEALREELKTIQKRGYALNCGESTQKLRAVAVPVVPEDEVIGAFAIAGPQHRLAEERLSETLPQLLLSVVNEIELNIAYSD